MAGAVPFTDRTCFRCGRDFPQFDKERLCPICRKPRTQEYKQQWDGRVGRPLSFREQEIAQLIAQAKSDKEIAFALRLSQGTIKMYMTHMLTALGPKLMARNRVAIAVWWITEGRAEYQEPVQTSANPEAA